VQIVKEVWVHQEISSALLQKEIMVEIYEREFMLAGSYFM